MSNSEETFRNRRGHRVSIGEAVNEIESEKKPTPQRVKNKKKPSVRKLANSADTKKKRVRRRLPKGLWLIVAFVVALIALITLVVFDATKRGYESAGMSMRRNVTTLSSRPFATDTKISDVTRDLISGLEASTDCSRNEFITSLYPPAAIAKEECVQVAKQYEELRTNLSDMESLSVYAESISALLRSPLKNPSSGTFASLHEYSSRWQEAEDAIKEMKTPTEAEQQIHKDLLTQVEQIQNGWNDLQNANAAQDRTAFESAEDTLAKNYQALRTTNETIVKQAYDKQQTIDGLVSSLSLE